MRLVPEPNQTPGYCLASSATQDPEGFIDCGHRVNFALPHSFIAVGAVRKMAELVGMVSGEEVSKARAETAEALVRLAELEEEVTRLREFERNAIYTLNHFHEGVIRKPGPKPKA